MKIKEERHVLIQNVWPDVGAFNRGHSPQDIRESEFKQIGSTLNNSTPTCVFSLSGPLPL